MMRNVRTMVHGVMSGSAVRSNHHTHASPAPITMPGLTDRHHANRVIAMGEIRTFGLPVQRHALITMQPCSTLGLMDAQRSRMVFRRAPARSSALTGSIS